MSYRLTDEEIFKLVREEAPQDYCQLALDTGRLVADAQITKHQAYLASLAPEKLKGKIALKIAEETSVYMLLKNYHEQDTALQEYLLSLGNSITGQILPLVMAWFIERVKGIENSHKPNPLREYDHTITEALKDGFDEAIQEVLKMRQEADNG